MVNVENSINQSQQRMCPAFVFSCSALLGVVMLSWGSAFAQAQPESEHRALPMITAIQPVGEAAQAENSKPNAAEPQALITVSREIHQSAAIQTHGAMATSKSTLKKAKTLPSQWAIPTQGATAPQPSVLSTAPAETAASVPISSASTANLQDTESTKTIELPESAINFIPEAEKAPLNQVMGHDALLGSAASQSLIRLLLGLTAVLATMLTFGKVILPRMMKRYPDFFQRLQSQAAQQALTKPVSPIKKPLANESASQAPFGWIRPTEVQDIPQPLGQELAVQLDNSAHQAATTSLMNRLAKNGASEIVGRHVQIIESEPLGQDKALHIVEIEGRRLVIASTPYTVSFIQELGLESTALKEEAAFSSIESGMNAEAMEENQTGFDTIYQPKRNMYASVPNRLSQGELKPVGGRFIRKPSQTRQPESATMGAFMEETLFLADYDDKYGY